PGSGLSDPPSPWLKLLSDSSRDWEEGGKPAQRAAELRAVGVWEAAEELRALLCSVPSRDGFGTGGERLGGPGERQPGPDTGGRAAKLPRSGSRCCPRGCAQPGASAPLPAGPRCPQEDAEPPGPREHTEPPGPQEHTEPPGPQEHTEPPGPQEHAEPPGPQEHAEPPGPQEHTEPPGPREHTEPPGPQEHAEPPSPQEDAAPPPGPELSLVPPELRARLLDRRDYRGRAQAVEQLRRALESCSPAALGAAPAAALLGLIALLDALLHDPNFAVARGALEATRLLALRLGRRVPAVLAPLVCAAARALGDAQPAMRRDGGRLLLRLMAAAGPRAVLRLLLQERLLRHRSARLREELLNTCTAALLAYPAAELDLPQLAAALAPALLDTKRRVRHAAMEALAALAAALGPGNAGALLRALDALELRAGGAGVADAVRARLARKALPRLGERGLVEHGVPLPSSGRCRGTCPPPAADTEWLLMGSRSRSAHGRCGHPACRDAPHGPAAAQRGASPRRVLSAGRALRNKLPWENEPGCAFISHTLFCFCPQLADGFLHSPKLQPSQGSPGSEELLFSRSRASRALLQPGVELNSELSALGAGALGSQQPQISGKCGTLGYPQARGKSGSVGSDLQFLGLSNCQQDKVCSSLSFSSKTQRSFCTQAEPTMSFQGPSASQGTFILPSFPLSSPRNGPKHLSAPAAPAGKSQEDPRSLSSSWPLKSFQGLPKPGCQKQLLNQKPGDNTGGNHSLQLEKPPLQLRSALGRALGLRGARPVPPVPPIPPGSREGTELAAGLAELRLQPEEVDQEEMQNSLRSLRNSAAKKRAKLSSSIADLESPDSGVKLEFSGDCPSQGSSPTGDSEISSQESLGSPVATLPPRRRPCPRGRCREPRVPQSPEVLDPSELQPLARPEPALATALALLAEHDWEKKIEGLNFVRCLSAYHAPILTAKLHETTLAVAQEVKNLRSGVSRAAVVCLGDLFTHLKKSMDQEVDNAVKVLLHKAGESNTFIREEVDKALKAMVNNVTPARALCSLINGGQSHLHSAVRRCTAQHLGDMLQRLGPERALAAGRPVAERLLPAIASFAQDSSQQTRYYGRKMLFSMMAHPDLDKILEKFVPAKDLPYIKETVVSLREKGLGEMPLDTPSAKGRRSQTGNVGHLRSSSTCRDAPIIPDRDSTESQEAPRRAAPRSALESEDYVRDMVGLLSARDFRERLGGVRQLLLDTESSPGLVLANLLRIFDAFKPRLHDSNSKVNQVALEAMHKMIPLLKDNLSPVINMLIPAIVDNNLNSKNPGIYAAATNVIQALCQHLDTSLLLQPFCTKAQFLSGKAKQDLTEKLAELVPELYPRKPCAVEQKVLPVLWHLLGSSASGGSVPGPRTATAALARALWAQMGPGLLAHAAAQPPHIRKSLEELLETGT
uniref:TOG array regulator of axonemal microtubules 1 n=1 Tax=Taeniopygia guttata TaxID=59729 RepID=H0ZSN3_TAEGU